MHVVDIGHGLLVGAAYVPPMVVKLLALDRRAESGDRPARLRQLTSLLLAKLVIDWTAHHLLLGDLVL